ncbi:hypothetical protein [Robbsia andropogonis]|uniref:hypothetical protein n=1 Tax=Robbsia andropogonis TaxID=28092 RepID=UPI002A6B5D13|nr:hypothetical protein [Robbsia andropogonis]
MELHPYRLDHGLTNVSQLDAADRPRLPTGPASLLPSDTPTGGPLQKLFREQGLDIYLLAALGVKSSTAPEHAPADASIAASTRAFAKPKSYGEALDRSCQSLERGLAAREKAVRQDAGRTDNVNATNDTGARTMRAAHRVLVSTREMRQELATYRGLVVAG